MGEYAGWIGGEKPYDDEPECISNVKLIHQTEKAYLLECKHGQFWIPVSIADLEGEEVCFPVWFAPKYQKPVKIKDEFKDLDDESNPE